jgi:hypothetical protein
VAELRIDGDDLVLHLSPTEHLEAVHGDLRAPLASVRSIDVLDDAHAAADSGFKIGERLPGVSEVATILSRDERLFAVVHPGTPRGLRISFEGTNYDAWIVGCADPEAVQRSLGHR